MPAPIRFRVLCRTECLLDANPGFFRTASIAIQSSDACQRLSPVLSTLDVVSQLCGSLGVPRFCLQVCNPFEILVPKIGVLYGRCSVHGIGELFGTRLGYSDVGKRGYLFGVTRDQRESLLSPQDIARLRSRTRYACTVGVAAVLIRTLLREGVYDLECLVKTLCRSHVVARSPAGASDPRKDHRTV